MKTTVTFTDDNKNFVKVEGAKTIDQAVTAADYFLKEYDLAVKNGGAFYGDDTDANQAMLFNAY